MELSGEEEQLLCCLERLIGGREQLVFIPRCDYFTAEAVETASCQQQVELVDRGGGVAQVELAAPPAGDGPHRPRAADGCGHRVQEAHNKRTSAELRFWRDQTGVAYGPLRLVERIVKVEDRR
eukprot:372004-Prymnesium_polylepis.1